MTDLFQYLINKNALPTTVGLGVLRRERPDNLSHADEKMMERARASRAPTSGICNSQNQRTKVKNKILWTLKVIETLPIVPEIYKALKIKSEYEQDRQ